jgi:hypothetical protein
VQSATRLTNHDHDTPRRASNHLQHHPDKLQLPLCLQALSKSLQQGCFELVQAHRNRVGMRFTLLVTVINPQPMVGRLDLVQTCIGTTTLDHHAYHIDITASDGRCALPVLFFLSLVSQALTTHLHHNS